MDLRGVDSLIFLTSIPCKISFSSFGYVPDWLLLSLFCWIFSILQKGIVAMGADSYSRKWQITINNPLDKDYTHEKLREILGTFNSMAYWCMSDEIGEGGTYHTHIFMVCSTVVRFSSVKKKFDGGHFEMAKGTSEQNRDYVFKQGKWEKDKKAETNLTETHEEYGEMPMERQGKRNDLTDLYDMIRSGMSNAEIMESDANYLPMLDKIDRARNAIIQEKFKNIRRLDIQVSYVSGSPECGKTRFVRDLYGDANLYSVDDYKHPFDGYSNEGIILFDEFRNSISLPSMLKYLDIYPCSLPSRYYNKIACYTKVFIVSNWALEQQYKSYQRDDKDSWNAFLRRIHNVLTYENGEFVCRSVQEYFRHLEKDFIPIDPSRTPWQMSF